MRTPTLVAAAFLLTACSDPPGAPALLEELPRPLSSAEARLVAATTDFAFPLLASINQDQADSNVFISPLSASMALGMTMNGAAGETYEAMRTALGFGTMEEADINAGYRDLIALLRGLDRSVVFEIANSVWYRQGFSIRSEFLAATRTWFDAEVAGLDFDSPAAVTTINGWVNDRTRGRIPQIIEAIDPEHVMFLINAIYFNGAWRNRFDPARTAPAAFHALDGSQASVPLMSQRLTAAYAATPELQIVDLPYGNGAFRMTVLLPAPGQDVNAVLAGLDRARWESLVAMLDEQEVDLWLPKFRLAWERRLNPDLGRLGMGVAFCEPPPTRADFSRIHVPQRLCIDYVKQKTFVDVDERGTEAAAVTVVAVRVVSLPVTPQMRVDRPFIFVLRERLSGTILFVGKIVSLPA